MKHSAPLDSNDVYRCQRCNRTLSEVCPWPDCQRANSATIRLLRAWVAGCGDERFSTEEQRQDLIQRSEDVLRAITESESQQIEEHARNVLRASVEGIGIGPSPHPEDKS